MSRLLCFGLGYSARELASRLPSEGWVVLGTSRQAATGALHFDRDHPLDPQAFEGVTHILLSVPPDATGDPVFDRHSGDIAGLPALKWLGYLSTTGVYGNRGGGWVDETSELRPTGERGRRRVAAEKAWLSLWQDRGVPVQVFRLAGIYGPGRSPFDALRTGTARRIDKPGQVFSRIHVADIAKVLAASMARPHPGAVYNVCDDEPAAPAAVVAFGAGLLGLPVPPLTPFDNAALSPIARSFYDDNKRVSNALIKSELGVVFHYPSYREGLAGILAEGG